MTSLSELWRENRSKDPGTELASILDGARVIAQSLNPKIEVTFAGIKTANTDMTKIYLSPRDLGDEYPINGDRVDVLLGLTVHEVGHTLFSEHKGVFIGKLERKATILSGDGEIFRRLVNIFEDIYIDHIMTAYPGYRDYLQRERASALGEFNPDSVIKPLESKCTRKDMLNALVYFTLAGGQLPGNISSENMATLSKIATEASRMCTKKTSKERAVLNAWAELRQLPSILTDEERGFIPPPPQSSDGDDKAEPVSEKVQADAGKERKEQNMLNGQDDEAESEEDSGDGGDEAEAEPEEEQGEGDGDGKEGQESPDEEPEQSVAGDTEEAEEDIGEAGEDMEEEEGVTIDTGLDLASRVDDLVDDGSKLSDELADEVSKAIVEKRADLTQLISYLAKDSRYTTIVYTPDEDAQVAANARSVTAPVEEKLRRILQDFRLKRTKDYRGLMGGRISSRRLHRVAYGDQRVFQRRDRPEEIDMAVCLLMDLSGSVHGLHELIEQVVCAICDAFQKEKMEFITLGYSESRGVVSIPRLYDIETGKLNLGLTKEWGMTPSYEGLAAAISQLLRLSGSKQKVLFHFTDGAPNTANSPVIPDLLDDARVKGITDIHVCLSGYRDSDDLVRAFNKFKQLYGENTMVIKDITELPDIVDQELRRRLRI